MARSHGQGDGGPKAELGGDLLPVLERRIGESVGHLDRAALARGFAAGAEAEPHAHLAKEGSETLRPIVHRAQPHELGGAIDEVNAGERGADERTHPIECELKDLFRPVGGEKGMHDLPDRNQLADTGIELSWIRSRALGCDGGAPSKVRLGHARECTVAYDESPCGCRSSTGQRSLRCRAVVLLFLSCSPPCRTAARKSGVRRCSPSASPRSSPYLSTSGGRACGIVRPGAAQRLRPRRSFPSTATSASGHCGTASRITSAFATYRSTRRSSDWWSTPARCWRATISAVSRTRWSTWRFAARPTSQAAASSTTSSPSACGRVKL